MLKVHKPAALIKKGDEKNQKCYAQWIRGVDERIEGVVFDTCNAAYRALRATHGQIHKGNQGTQWKKDLVHAESREKIENWWTKRYGSQE